MTDEPSPRPWRVNSLTGGHISDANGDPVCFCVGSDCAKRAGLIVDAVNERDRLRAELDALRTSYNELHSELADKTSNYEGVIAYHRRTEESLRDIVRRLTEYADAVTGYRPRAVEVLSSEHPAWTFDGAALLREARAAIGEDKQ